MAGKPSQTKAYRTQRLKEAIWRVQGLVRRGGMSMRRARIVDEEMELLATHLGVQSLNSFDRCPVCGNYLPLAAHNEVRAQHDQ